MDNIALKFSTGEIESGLSRLEKKIKDEVLISAAAAMARPIYEEVKRNASPPRMGRVSGNLAQSIYRVFSPEKSTPAQKTYRISWNKRTAPHGHLLEFGTSRAPAKPFVRPAFDHINAGIKAGLARMTERLKNGGGGGGGAP